MIPSNWHPINSPNAIFPTNLGSGKFVLVLYYILILYFSQKISFSLFICLFLLDLICLLVSSRDCDIFCFKFKLQNGANVGINHPNQYFDESVKLLKNLKIVEDTNKTQPAK